LLARNEAFELLPSKALNTVVLPFNALNVATSTNAAVSQAILHPPCHV
jgi:hypothetical protein